MERDWLRQAEWQARFEWGPTGVSALSAESVVVVDVLRFTTAVDAAVSRQAIVYPFRWKDDLAEEYARERDAELADPGSIDGPSLSPVSLLSLGAGDRLVLPSPNGATCAFLGESGGSAVYAACLRNAAAVGRWIRAHHRSVVVIACGERWPDGSLRPALEDYLGAGAVLDELDCSLSPEAELAKRSWRGAVGEVGALLADCVSGRQAAQRGWERDIEFASAVGASDAVPRLVDGGFVDAAAPPG